MQVYNNAFRTESVMNIQKNPASHIFERKSIRQYRSESIQSELLARIPDWVEGVQGLEQASHFAADIHDFDLREKPSQALGGFGRIMSPPHFLAPLIIGGEHALVDLGFRTQQIVMDMWGHGIGSCYIGCVHRQKRAKTALGVPTEATIAAFIVFGVPDWNQPERLYRQISRLFTRSHRRKPLEDLFLDSDWQEMATEASILRHVLEAGRHAPSAMNAQPWRFRIKDGKLAVFAKINDANRIYDLNQDYPLHDAGICLANMYMAAREFGCAIEWNLSETRKPEFIKGQQLMRIADFPIKDFRRKVD